MITEMTGFEIAYFFSKIADFLWKIVQGFHFSAYLKSTS
jgi:hypothetical protein